MPDNRAKSSRRMEPRKEVPVQALVPVSQNLPGVVTVSPPDTARESQRAELPFSHYLWLIRTHWLKMVAFVVLVLIATTFVTLRLTPIYEATATLYVDRGAAKNLVGQDSQSSSASTNEADVFLASQMKMLQSDSVVRPLAEKYNLLEREKQINPAKDDKRKIAMIDSAPIVLKGLRITRPPNTYILQVSYRSSDPEVATAVANGIANSFIEHLYEVRVRSSATLSKFMGRQLDELRAKTEASTARLVALEQELNVINPEEKTNILSARLLQINTEYTKIQGERVRAQSIHDSLAAGSLEAALMSPQGEDLRGIVKRLNEARERFADIRTRYGAQHPEYARLEGTVKELQSQVDATVQSLVKQSATEYQRALNQEALLQKDVKDTKAEYDHLNLRSFEYQRAKQEADANRALYEELVKKIREDEINSGFQNDMVRITDPARPASRPVFPSIPLNLMLAFMLSSILAVAAVILTDRLDTTVRNPEQLERSLNASVIGVLPLIKTSRTATLALHSSLAPAGSEDPASGAATHALGFEEAVRTIRNSILLSQFDRSLRSILMTSATPSEGKSTIAAHLAVSNAEQCRKTLLIDGDTRRPSLHKILGVANTNGLSTVLEQGQSWRDAVVRPRPDIDLYVLPAGPASRRAADSVGRFLPQLLEEAGQEYDLIILDAPPLLGFSEPLQMAVAVDGVVVVVRAGQTDRSAVGAVLNTLHQLRANVIGVVLNELRKEMVSGYHYYDNYGKYYGKRKEDKHPRSA